MPDSSDPSNLNLFSSGCLAETGVFEPDVHRDEAVYVQKSCENPFRALGITCKTPFRDEFVDEARGLAFDLGLKAIDLSLPSHVPGLDRGLESLPRSAVSSPVVAVSLVDVLRSGVYYEAGSWRETKDIRFNIPLLLSEATRGKKVILLPSGQDTMIEWLWHQRDECGLFEQLHMMGFALTAGLNFSVIKGECSFMHRLNQKRSLYSALLAERAGIPAVPHVYAVTPFHVDAWVKYFRQNPQTKLFMTNCQLQRSAADIRTVVDSTREILEQVPWEIHVMLVGFPISEIHQFGKFLDRIHFVDKAAFKYAQRHRKFVLNFETTKLEVRESHEPVPFLTEFNINQRRMYIELAKAQAIQGYTLPDDVVASIERRVPEKVQRSHQRGSLG